MTASGTASPSAETQVATRWAGEREQPGPHPGSIIIAPGAASTTLSQRSDPAFTTRTATLRVGTGRDREGRRCPVRDGHRSAHADDDRDQERLGGRVVGHARRGVEGHHEPVQPRDGGIGDLDPQPGGGADRRHDVHDGTEPLGLDEVHRAARPALRWAMAWARSSAPARATRSRAWSAPGWAWVPARGWVSASGAGWASVSGWAWVSGWRRRVPACGRRGRSTRIGSQRTPAFALAGIALATPDVNGSVSRVLCRRDRQRCERRFPEREPAPDERRLDRGPQDGPAAGPAAASPVPVDPARSSSAVTPRETSDR